MLRRWPSFKPTLCQRLVFAAGMYTVLSKFNPLSSIFAFMHHITNFEYKLLRGKNDIFNFIWYRYNIIHKNFKTFASDQIKLYFHFVSGLSYFYLCFLSEIVLSILFQVCLAALRHRPPLCCWCWQHPSWLWHPSFTQDTLYYKAHR